jgi:uncharacterized protein (TIGR02145 family)
LVVLCAAGVFLVAACTDDYGPQWAGALTGGATAIDPGATWTDDDSGLVWQKDWAGTKTWNDAKTYCARLTGTGWHLPTISELRSLIRGCAATQTGGSCNVQEGDCLAWSCRDGSCDGCSSGGGPASGCYWDSDLGGNCTWFWSSSLIADDSNDAWYVFFDYGLVNYDYVDGDEGVRCVRPGP